MMQFVPLDGRSSLFPCWFVTKTYSKELTSPTLFTAQGV
jgi:hypothetical protein